MSTYQISPDRVCCERDPKIYGHFLEHFHRQIYGGVFDPDSPLADDEGFRTDVLEALRRIRVPIIRWPGGCFVSTYHWQKGVGERVPSFDKAWRVEDPNTFGTDEFIRLCEKLDCEPYICTNAGSGTEEEMSDWMEYCNLEKEGEFARMRIRNGHPKPYGVRYWSIGNENYGGWELGAKDSDSWARLALEAAKMMKHVWPDCSLSAAAIPELDWNVKLLRACHERLDWISIHAYWDPINNTNALAPYERCMAYTASLDDGIVKVRGLLRAMGIKNIRIAFDEWNLRGWYHPNVHTVYQGRTPEEYILPRDKNDINASYTMADAVFSACFLNTLLRNADLVKMANFAPVVNTRGAIYTHAGGIVLRTTYHVFDLYVNRMGERVIDLWCGAPERYEVAGVNGTVEVDVVDAVATLRADGVVAVALVNKHETQTRTVEIEIPDVTGFTLCTLDGDSPDAYNDVDAPNRVMPRDNTSAVSKMSASSLKVTLPAHSVNILEIRRA